MGQPSKGSPLEEFRRCLAREEKNEANIGDVTLRQTYSRQLGELGSDVADKESGFKTPTSPDRKIPVIPKLPRAPKKPKAKKRMRCPVILLDVSEQIEAMFPVAAGSRHPFNGNMKRVKVEVDF